MALFCLFISSEDHSYDGGVGVNPRVPTRVSTPPHSVLMPRVLSLALSLVFFIASK